ncbi:CoA-acylating methylmalonate-semialdehyde dehydrogenase [Autumnicola psychrophila]|uniref:methylmalonate-semialdehyde dehydrogenase (CoA acylating) n=1 Tax=Autumnicola psychrophila TaxID=3075592 RepID=A0ABU3DN02_9FLAO|nr:CoA-acylating methylmalonate-semialdehyde dehydrogenase [Zunongwangia sp. F225]MDT0684988.1 CoA-acylating methylmalonate-semialdehyde dehydrogenase [Zunongwangia sp. F225]
MEILKNYIGGSWIESKEKNTIDIVNPASLDILGKVPFGVKTNEDVQVAVDVASKAYLEWKEVPVMKRVQPLYQLKRLLEENAEDIAKTITEECGKTIGESRGELQRAIENVEVACGTPMLIQSEFSENIAGGIDEFMIRQPLGVCACISPFNFPGMIPFWFLPYAIACGNTFILKPSEKVPLTMMKVFKLIDQLEGLPKGVVNLVHGGKETVDGLLEHKKVKAISFVGSTNVAKYIYSKGAAHGKRVQAQGGAKNPVVILPDADLEMSVKIITDSVYGCAGQRCLAASNVITVGDDGKIKDAIYEAAKARSTGYGLDENVEMGPVINGESRARIENHIAKGVDEGANLLLDGRNLKVSGFESGNFVGPTIIQNPPFNGKTVHTEIFGPVMSLIDLATVDDALEFVNRSNYGNMACLFTSSGANARKFRNQANVGNVGINIGVAAPMAQFPFSGWNDSFFGDLHGQGHHAIEFFTQTKVVIERWPKEWSRKF